RHSGPHEVGRAALLSGRGGRVVAYATTPESCQGRRAKRALTRFVPGGVPPARPEPIKTALGAPRSGDGRSPQRPWGACCGIRHNTGILSRPKSEACLDKIRSGGASPSQARTDQDGTRGPTKWGRPHSSAAVGGVLWHTPQHPNLVKAEERSVP